MKINVRAYVENFQNLVQHLPMLRCHTNFAGKIRTSPENANDRSQFNRFRSCAEYYGYFFLHMLIKSDPSQASFSSRGDNHKQR